MSKYRHELPQLGDALFLTDGGLETTLIFHDGVDLPYFAAFDLLKDDAGRATLRRYFERYVGRREGARRRPRPRNADVARERRLGSEARLRRERARGGQPSVRSICCSTCGATTRRPRRRS